MLRTTAVAVQRGAEARFELLADDLGSTRYRVRFSITVDPTICWPLHASAASADAREQGLGAGWTRA